jgi:hypothetical protein
MAYNQSSKSLIQEKASKSLKNYHDFKKAIDSQSNDVLQLIGDGGNQRHELLDVLEKHYAVNRNSRVSTFFNALIGGEDWDGWIVVLKSKIAAEYRKEFDREIGELFDMALAQWVEELLERMPAGRKTKEESDLPIKFGECFYSNGLSMIEQFGWADSPAASGEHIEERKRI